MFPFFQPTCSTCVRILYRVARVHRAVITRRPIPGVYHCVCTLRLPDQDAVCPMTIVSIKHRVPSSTRYCGFNDACTCRVMCQLMKLKTVLKILRHDKLKRVSLTISYLLKHGSKHCISLRLIIKLCFLEKNICSLNFMFV